MPRAVHPDIADAQANNAAPQSSPAPLPGSLAPRGLSRAQVAAYVGVSPTTFDRMVADRLMPKPLRIYGRVVWDRKKVDAAIDALDTSDIGDDAWSRMRV